MRFYFIAMLLGGALLAGCSTDHFEIGHGDAGKFILNETIARGGHPIETNNLPPILGTWHYKADQFGLVVKLSPQQSSQAATFLLDAFGKPRREDEDAGGKFAMYRLATNGGAIQLASHKNYTSVIVLRPLEKEQVMDGIFRSLKATNNK